MSRRAMVWWAEWRTEAEMLIEMLELGHRAWYPLVTGDKEWIRSMRSSEDAPESGATSQEQKPKQ